MRPSILVLSTLSFTLSAHAATPRGLLGPIYPPPRDLTGSSSLVPAAWSAFTSAINSQITRNKTIQGLIPDIGSVTLSVGGFSIYDSSAASFLQYHHTGTEVLASPLGSHEAGPDSIYRIGSVSKLFMVYLMLLEVGSSYWTRPVTDFLPELIPFANLAESEPLLYVDWREVTLGALAGQIAGIPHETYPYNTDFLANLLMAGTDPTTLGFPPLSLNPNNTLVFPPCAQYQLATNSSTCPASLYLSGLGQRAPVFPPWTTPAYSDTAFTLLRLSLESITNTSFPDLLSSKILNPLSMASTSTIPPTNLSRAIIPLNSSTTFLLPAGIVAASGGLFSSTTDLASLGLSILSSSLLDPVETRKWLHPIANTASLRFSVGRPWEIFRLSVGSGPSHRQVDLYTKAGDVPGGYSAYMILIPDYGVGFSILAAHSADTALFANRFVADALTSTLLPALEAEAAREAALNIAGTYTDTLLNSSLTLTANASLSPGLLITSWTSNSTNMLTTYTTLLGYDLIALFPLGPSQTYANGSSEQAYRATFAAGSGRKSYAPFMEELVGTYAAWESMDAYEYGGVGLDLFTVGTDGSGRAEWVDVGALRMRLGRAGS